MTLRESNLFSKSIIYGIETIDQGIEVLTGVKAGRRGKDGKYPKDSINNAVDEKIKQYTERLKKISEREPKN